MEPFTIVHKAIRSAMFDAVRDIARTDFTRKEQALACAARVRALIGYLDEHAAHEDRVILPVLAEIGPAVHAELQADHNRIGGIQRETEALADRIEAAATAEERAALGLRLHATAAQLTAEHLLHMNREETTAARVLWAHKTDEELQQLHVAIVSAIPPARLVAWAEMMIPSIAPAERQTLLAGLERGLPAELFSRLAAHAERLAAPEGQKAAA